jgi:hypothetical protein
VGNRLRAFPNPENSSLTLIQGRGRCIEAKIENIRAEGYVAQMTPLGSFYVGNRLRVFPNPENTSLTLLGNLPMNCSETIHALEHVHLEQLGLTQSLHLEELFLPPQLQAFHLLIHSNC